MPCSDPSEPEAVEIKFQGVLSDWPLYLEAAPGHQLEVQITSDGNTVETRACSKLAVLSCKLDGADIFSPWEDPRSKISKAMRELDNVPGWDGQTFSSLVLALADWVENGSSPAP